MKTQTTSLVNLGTVEVAHETEKAVEIRIENGAGQTVRFQWIPKSCLKGSGIEQGSGYRFIRDCLVAKWFVAQNRLWPATQRAF
jgi:hypothetical protein